jgi:hypothetical protein
MSVVLGVDAKVADKGVNVRPRSMHGPELD